MEVRRLPIVLGVLLVTAGCLGATDAGEDANVTPTNATTPDTADTDGATTDGDGPTDGAPAEATLTAPPDWRIGEWWTVELTSSLTGETVEMTRVVAGTEGEDYLIGQPEDAWSTEGLVFHVPGLGEVRQDDLSYEVHDVRFQPLQFPLTDGASWQTSFEGLDVEASVTTTDAGTAEIHYCCGRNITATYDPGVRAITSFDADDGFISYEVIDHGYDYTGVVTVPHGHDLIFNHGRVAGALSASSTQPAPPVEEVELDPDYQRVSFVQIAGPLGVVEQPISSAYIERATNPNGTTFETQHLPTDGGSFTVNFFETTELGGTWSFEHAAPGPGLAFTEGIAYHVFNMKLPEGHLLGDHGEHVTE